MRAPYLDVLVPSDPGDFELVDRINRAKLKDAGRQVRLGCLDEALINLVIDELRSGDLHLSVPAGRQDLAIALGIYLQLDRRGKAMRQRRDVDDFDGPIVVVGLNLNVTERLRLIRIGVNDLSKSLIAGRVRGDGDVIGLDGIPSRARAWRHGLLYLNISLGYPTLNQVQPEVVIVDATTLRNPDSLERALRWCTIHNARRILLVSELGSDTPTCVKTAPTWLSFPLTPAIVGDVRQTLGACHDGSALSTNALVTPLRRHPSVAVYRAPAIALARRQALCAIATARKLPSPQPESIRNAVRLVNGLGQLWGKPSTADRFAIEQGRTFSIASLDRRVATDQGMDLHGGWATFRETHWADLRRACLDLFRLISENNPRLALLKELLAWAEANRPGVPICIRTVSRSAASALIEDLKALKVSVAASPDAEDAQVTVRPYSQRLPWTATSAIEFHLGAPPPWRHASIFAGSATEHVVVLEQDEVPGFKRSLEMLSASWEEDLKALSDATDLDFPLWAAAVSARKVFGPITIDHRGEEDATEEFVQLPAFDLAGLFESFNSTVIHAVEDPEEANCASPTVQARCLTLDDGRRYYLPLDSQIETLIADDYHVILLADLTSGMTVLLSRGESHGRLLARLKLASHNEIDVRAANLMLSRFRNAVKDLHAKEGTWEKVAKAIRRYGSQVESGATCHAWAFGTSIAPDDVQDIRRVFWAIGDNRLSADGTCERLGEIAKELRHLHRGLGHIISLAIGEVTRGRRGPNCEVVEQSCGFDPMEILEEFQVAKVRSIDSPELVDRSQLRHLLPAQGRPAAI